jgi:hypothetical protein
MCAGYTGETGEIAVGMQHEKKTGTEQWTDESVEMTDGVHQWMAVCMLQELMDATEEWIKKR